MLLEVDVVLGILLFTIIKRPCAVSGARRRPHPLGLIEMDTGQVALWAASSPHLPRPLLSRSASDAACPSFVL